MAGGSQSYSSLPQSDPEASIGNGNAHGGAGEHIPTPRSSSEYPPSRRISASIQSFWHRRQSAGTYKSVRSPATAILTRPRAVALCFAAILIAVLTIHDDSRNAAHNALSSVGIPIPKEMPDLSIPDNVKAGIHKWTGGMVGGPEDAPSWASDDTVGKDATKGHVDADAIEWQNTTTPKDPSQLLDEAEPFVNKMVYHPTNGYLLLPDPSKPNAVKAIMEERHPILELISNAEKKWDDLVKRQSKTLKEAVAEYKRRYMRNPPKGFDKW